MNFLTDAFSFPPVDTAAADGLLALGGDLHPQRLLQAYKLGIFPWYNEGEIIQWWCPDPRFVLFPAELKVSRSMKQLLTRNTFSFTINKAFDAVINNCRVMPRAGQNGTWIQDEVVQAYNQLHQMGVAVSAEAWKDGELAGGLYGLRIGTVFFGESMFSKQSNASKYAFIKLVQLLRHQHVKLVDCQVYTSHLESLGARMISRKQFVDMLAKEIPQL